MTPYGPKLPTYSRQSVQSPRRSQLAQVLGRRMGNTRRNPFQPQSFGQAINRSRAQMQRQQGQQGIPPGVVPTKPTGADLPDDPYQRLNALRALTHGYNPSVKGNPEVAKYRDLSRQEQLDKRKFLRNLLAQTWKGNQTRNARAMNFNPTYTPLTTGSPRYGGRPPR